MVRPPRALTITIIVAAVGMSVVIATTAIPATQAATAGTDDPPAALQLPSNTPDAPEERETSKAPEERETSKAPEERETSNESNASVSIWRVPHDLDAENATASDLERHEATDDAADTETESEDDAVPITPGDRLAIAVHVPGLDARVANATGNDTERVLAALRTDGFFSIRQTLRTTTPERVPSTVWLNASTVRALDAGDDRYVLVVDQTATLGTSIDEFEDDVATRYQEARDEHRFFDLYDESINLHAEYAANYYLNNSTRGRVAQSDPVAFRPAAIDVDVDGPVAPEANVTLTGMTTLAPGTEIEVTVRNQTDAVLASASTTVAADGRIEAAVDLSTAATPANLSITAAAVDYPGEVGLDPASVSLRDPKATIDFTDQVSSTGFVSVRANLSHGGVLVLRNDTTVVDTTTTLTAGTTQTATFTLSGSVSNGTYQVVAYRGTTGDPYPDGTASARIQITPEDDEDGTRTQDSEATTTLQTSAPTDEPTTAGSARTTPGKTTGTTDDGPISGFGALAAIAGIVVAGCARLATRRRSPGDS